MVENIPSSLILEINFNISDEEIEKNKYISLDVNKDILKIVNDERVKNNKQIISFTDIDNFLNLISIDEIKMEIVLKDESNENHCDLYNELIDCLSISKKVINPKDYNQFVYLNYDEKVKDYMVEDSEDLFDGSYKDIIINKMISRIGVKNYEKIKDGSSKYKNLFHTLLKEDLSKIKVLYNDLKETESHKFYKNDDLLIYLPDNYIVQKPLNLNGNELEIDSIDYTLKIPGINEKILYKFTVDGHKNINEEQNMIYQNFSQIETSLYPILFKDEDGEMMVSKPLEKRKYYLKLFYGIKKDALYNLLNNTNNSIESI